METSPPSMTWRTALDIIWSHPVLADEAPLINDICRWLTWWALAEAAIRISLVLKRSVRKHRLRNPQDPRLPRGFKVFLVLTFVAFFVTTALRFEHKRIKWLVDTGQLDVAAANADHRNNTGELNAVDRTYFNDAIMVRRDEKLDEFDEGFSKKWEPPYRAGENYGREWMPEVRVQEKCLRQARDEVRAEAGLLPYFQQPMDWPVVKRTTWEYMDMLVESIKVYFWTTQWTAGYFAWLLYLVIECERRRLSGRMAMSFAFVGALCSLAVAQSLFFALLLVTPTKRTGKVFVPRAWMLVSSVLAQVFFLHAWASFVDGRWPLHPIGEIGRPGWPATTRSSQLYMIYVTKLSTIAPAVCVLSFKTIAWPKRLWNRRVAALQAKRQHLAIWFMIAVCSCYVRWDTVSLIWNATAKKRRKSFFLGVSTHPWLGNRNPMDHYNSQLLQTFGMLGKTIWANALAFDVLFSAVALASWSVGAQLDTTRMFKSGLFPWIDPVTEAIKLWTYSTLPDVTANGGLRERSAEHAGRDCVERPLILIPGDKGYEQALSLDDDNVPSRRPPWRTRRDEQSRSQSREPFGMAAPSLPHAPAPPRANGRKVRSASSRARSPQPAPALRRGRSRSAAPVQDTADRRVSSRGRGSSSPCLEDGPSTTFDFEESGPDLEGGRSLLLARADFKDRAGPAEQAGITLALFALGGLGMASAAVLGAEE